MTGQPDTAPLPATKDAGAAEARPRMWRAAWRQHRVWVIGAVSLVVAGGVALAVIRALVPACASTDWWDTPGATCPREPSETLWDLYVLALQMLPILIGAVLGALAFGPDIENRTHVYSLTQTVGRTRWWAVKVVTTAAPVFVAAVLLGMATLWAVDAADDTVMFTNRLTTPGFDILGLLPATRFLLAYAAAAAAVLFWRTIGGLVAGLVIAALAAIAVGFVQPHVVTHQRDLIPIQEWLASGSGETTDEVKYPSYSVLSAYRWSGYADADGRDIDTVALGCGTNNWPACLTDNNVAYRVESYVANSQFPQMMLIISGINLIISGGLLLLGAQRLRRQDL